jgi:hypothetical protein
LATLFGEEMKNKYQVGDIFVRQSNKSSSKNISTIVGYGYKPHLKCFAYNVQQHYINHDGFSSISNYETEELSLSIMINRDGYTHYPVKE